MSTKSTYAAIGIIAATAMIPIVTTNSAHAFGLSDYNLLVFEDLDSHSEVEGNAFIGGTLNGSSSNYCIKCYSGGGFSPVDGGGLKVVGDINGNPKQVNNGADLEYGGNVNTQINTNGGGSQTKNTALANEMLDLSTFWANTSTQLAQLKSNSSVVTPGPQPGAVQFNSTGEALAVFNINVSQLFSTQTQQIELNLNGSDTAIINISGTSANWTQGNMVGALTNDATKSRVVWNFFEAETLQLNNGFHGSLLAPTAHLTNQTELEGSVVVKSMTQKGEVHLPEFMGTLPIEEPLEPGIQSVPEPASLIGTITALTVAVVSRRKQ